jgi:hypothetical protein
MRICWTFEDMPTQSRWAWHPEKWHPRKTLTLFPKGDGASRRPIDYNNRGLRDLCPHCEELNEAVREFEYLILHGPR